MRERSRDKNRLEHMLQAIERICRYTKGKNFEDFIADDMILKSASNLNGNLNCSKELEHYAS